MLEARIGLALAESTIILSARLAGILPMNEELEERGLAGKDMAPIQRILATYGVQSYPYTALPWSRLLAGSSLRYPAIYEVLLPDANRSSHVVVVAGRSNQHPDRAKLLGMPGDHPRSTLTQTHFVSALLTRPCTR